MRPFSFAMPVQRSLEVALARPLEDDWRASLEAVARAHGWPSAAEPARLGALVRALSEAYNATATPGRAVAASAPAVAARLGFSFARDVPKAAAAVRELVGAGELGARPTLRVLDVGAGLGATTWGVARALAAAGRSCTLDVTWSDEDALALDVAVQLAKARDRRQGGVTLEVRTERTRVAARREPAGPDWDLVLLGQVLSELDAAVEDAERVARHADLLAGLVARLAPGGALVVIEPALRERTRHLHAVRDAALATHACSVFAPCLHAAACPTLAVPDEWCHEDVAVDLPPWLEPVARAAGLRWQGLTFSYLVLRRAGEPTLASALGSRSGYCGRVISDALVSKGKQERFLCREVDAGLAERARIGRLDRDASETNAAWDDLARGDLVGIDPAPDPKRDKGRLGRASRVERFQLRLDRGSSGG